MKILLAQNASYYPSMGGANKSNKILCEELVKLGNECRVLCTTPYNPTEKENLSSFNPVSISNDVLMFHCNHVNVHAVKVYATMDSIRLQGYLLEQINSYKPDWILISSEDVGQVLLQVAVETVAHKVIYLARTTLYLPFGPDCFYENPSKSNLLSKVAGVISVGTYLSDYMKTWGNVDSVVLPISLFGKGPFQDYGNFDSGYVTMINPCAFKGISIFLSLARAFPEIEFAAVPTWGTTSEDMSAMKELTNITLFEPVEDMDLIFQKTKVMLVPSLWAEAKSRTIVEAMVRGIPVMASDVGGNPEAKLGVEYVIAVNPIRGYQECCDERKLPVSNVPEQDIGIWKSPLSRLLSDRGHYEDVSTRSRREALKYIENRGGCEQVEAYLRELLENANDESKFIKVTQERTRQADRLTPAQKTLLALKLSKKWGENF